MPGFFDRLSAFLRPDGEQSSAELYEIRGFRVVVENSRPDIATSAVLARLDESLGLIEQYQPWRLAHLRRDLTQFWIVRYACRGAFFPQTRTCMTELTFLARTDISAAPVAASIVHEGMHARVHERNVRPEVRDSGRPLRRYPCACSPRGPAGRAGSAPDAAAS